MRLTLVLSVLVASAQLTHGLRSLRALTTTYPRCTASQTKTFKDNLNKATRDCASVSSYVWDGNDDPNDEQRAGICQCMMTPLSVPKCSWLKETSYPVSVLEHVTFLYNCAKTSGYPLPTVTEVELASYTSTSTTTAPAATTASPTPTTASPTPTTSKSSSSSSTSSTPAPTATTTAPDCTVQQLTAFTTALNTASSGCTSSSSYNWGGSADPTNAQYAALCKCTSVSTFTIPNCSVSKSGYVVTLETHYNWVITQQCGTYSPSAAGSTTETTTTTDEKKSSSNIGMIAGIAGGVVVVVLIIGFVMCKRKGKGKQDETQAHVATNNTTQSPAPYQPMATTPAVEKTYNMHAEARPSGVSSQGTRTTISTQNGSVRPSAAGSLGSSSASVRMTETATWDDPAIVAARIPHDDIFFGTLLSRGGFGEVFRGTYKGETVAIKQLLPARRKDLEQISDFLGEVKLMSTLEHDRIVKFIGVAWNSLSDACMVVEYMENGDLRSVLTRWDEGTEKRVNGFDADKVKIALHIAHALLYLHSLQPVVVHRDLKSKNILLDGNMDAKLTDFGISRERADATMTAGVGSSLWMAPEVMMGNRYDEKADIFSFGVVLSELDTHQQPYFHARETETGQKVPETAILQQVMLGRVSVGFTDRADPELVQLGRECVSLDPRERPTTAQLLHRVNQIMRQYR